MHIKFHINGQHQPNVHLIQLLKQQKLNFKSFVLKCSSADLIVDTYGNVQAKQDSNAK